MRILSLATFSLVLLAASSAWALQQSEPDVDGDGDGIQFIEMGPMDIDGNRINPDGQQTVVRTNARFHSLLTIRSSFNDEIIKSANDPALR